MRVDKQYMQYYREGYIAFMNGAKEDDNPYEPSGHERETTYQDEMHYAWYIGWNDAEDDRNG